MSDIKSELSKSIYAEPDDSKAVAMIINRVEQDNKNNLPYVTKMKAEEMLLSIRYDAASIKAEHLYDNTAEIPAFVKAFSDDAISLSKIKLSTPDEYQNSLLRQKVEHDLTAMKSLFHYLDVDPKKDSQYIDSIQDAIIAGKDVLKRAYNEAYDDLAKMATIEAQSQREQRYDDMKNSVIRAETVFDAMVILEMYNNNYCAGEWDIAEVYKEFLAEKEIDTPDIFDMDHKSQLYIELSSIYEAKRLVNNKSELITAISDLEGTLSALAVSKEFGFDTEGLRKINDQLEISLPVLKEVSALIKEQPQKLNLSDNLIHDVHKVLDKAKTVMAMNEQENSVTQTHQDKQLVKMR